MRLVGMDVRLMRAALVLFGFVILAALTAGRAHAQTVDFSCPGGTTCTFVLNIDAGAAIAAANASVADAVAHPEIFGVTHDNIGIAIGAGLSFILLMWFGGYVAATGVGLIKKI